MRILLTANSSWNIFNFRQGIIQNLLRNGHEVIVLAPAGHQIYEIEGVEYVNLNMDAKSLNPFASILIVLKIVKTLRDLRPDYVFSWTVKNNIFGALAARWVGVPFIPNVSGLGTAFLSGNGLQFLAEKLYSYSFKKLEIIFFQNEEDRNLFVSKNIVFFDQTVLLPGSGVDLEKFQPEEFPGGPICFLMISRLIIDKGIYEFIEAARIIKEKYPEIKFQILGSIDVTNRGAICYDTVAAWEAEGIIEYLGSSLDVRPYIARSHCIVLPSYREGAPRSLLEAAAMARPVIASDVPGCRSVVNHGKTGLLCKARDANSLAEAMTHFIVNGSHKEMGDLARVHAIENFDEKFVISAYSQAISKYNYDN